MHRLRYFALIFSRPSIIVNNSTHIPFYVNNAQHTKCEKKCRKKKYSDNVYKKNIAKITGIIQRISNSNEHITSSEQTKNEKKNNMATKVIKRRPEQKPKK